MNKHLNKPETLGSLEKSNSELCILKDARPPAGIMLETIGSLKKSNSFYARLEHQAEGQHKTCMSRMVAILLILFNIKREGRKDGIFIK